MCSDIAIRVDSLSKRFEIFDQPRDRLKQMLIPRIQRGLGKPPSQFFKEFWALNDVSLEVRRGDTVGIIGRNGSGKSTLLQIICGTLTPTLGSVEVKGKVAALLELGSGFNPEFTGRENVYLNASLYGLTDEQVHERFSSIENFAEIGEFIDQPVKAYSSGMMVRLAFSVIAHVDADILVVDEALSVGDAIFTQKCMRFIRSFQKRGTLLFVSHDASAIQNLCKSAIWLSNGKVRKTGSATAVSDAYFKYSLQEIYGNEAKLIDLDNERSHDNSFATEQEELRDNIQIYDSEYTIKNNLCDANGWTTGKAKITSVEVLDVSGKALTLCQGGEYVRVRICAEAYCNFQQPILGFLVKDRLGQDLFGENTLPFTAIEQKPVQAGQKITAEFGFELPMLPDGQYALMSSFADGDLRSNVQHHWLHDAAIIHVSSSKVRWGLVGLQFRQIELKIS
ncbi:ABC transporter ATP-binding protein [Marinobacter persicus]|uniref:Lipopolysaccharide transport system ATP-binding protein n=1 Tax=Marinobacter persicus TaxID=930118 RepID=A0A2S6G2D9_9GAMM|nr:ABC transporter ATP-binding protein [Marinobacter persicus]PPK49981.1 lipopolysaccharide transport system ATP-binding protein [Marinobacter persicus]PPK51896.1 lipopolysaccharide transport system ATP-binding protein [Marinobacter persicus]PPK56563.1 lipopolysaccharide transport system ATP-binding protein [Marinobacter persicus]